MAAMSLRHQPFHHAPSMAAVRPIFAILVAIGMFLAPLAIRGGVAMAMPQSGHHEQMAMADHCGEQSSSCKHEKSGKNADCLAMCMAVALAPASDLEPQALAVSRDRPALDRFGRSFLAELPTPPPRLA
jgi:hypothetical protein